MASVTDRAKLFDMLTRHQIYLEGVKLAHTREFDLVLRELNDEFRRLFSHLNYNKLDELSRSRVKDFIAQLKRLQLTAFNRYTSKLIRAFQDFMTIDIDVSTYLFETDTEKSVYQAQEDKDGLPLFGWFNPGYADDHVELWGTIQKSPIPANGVLLAPFINGFTQSAAKSVENTIMKGYVNGDAISVILAEILGTPSNNFRDGAFNRLNGQAAAVVDTALQHISSIAQSAVASIFYDRYQWVSVLDSSTTEICRGRNGRIYRYGQGPLPPAHIRCRSKTVPVRVGSPEEDNPTTYYGWLKTQPASVQDDILGAAAERLRNGQAKAGDFERFTATKPLTAEQFKAKRKLMTAN